MALKHPPERLCVLAQFVVNDVPWFIGWIIAQRQIDMSRVAFGLAPAQGDIGLLGLAVMELARQFAMGVGVAGDDQQAGGFPVQSMNDAGFGVAVFLQAGDQAVLVVLGAAGDRQ